MPRVVDYLITAEQVSQLLVRMDGSTRVRLGELPANARVVDVGPDALSPAIRVRLESDEFGDVADGEPVPRERLYIDVMRRPPSGGVIGEAIDFIDSGRAYSSTIDGNTFSLLRRLLAAASNFQAEAHAVREELEALRRVFSLDWLADADEGRRLLYDQGWRDGQSQANLKADLPKIGKPELNRTYIELGVKSRQTIAQELGLNWEGDNPGGV